MLALTEGAAEAIRKLTAAPAAEGVRISATTGSLDGTEPALRIELASAPQEEDAVVEAEGAQLYVEPIALQLLDDKVLDAAVEEDQIRFAVLAQPEGGEEV